MGSPLWAWFAAQPGLFAAQPGFLFLAPVLCPSACPQASGTKEGEPSNLTPHGQLLHT